MMLLADVVAASRRVASTRSRKEKVVELASMLVAAGEDELPVVAGLLAGEPRQGRIGLGWAAVASVDVEPAVRPTLTPLDVDGFLDAVPALTGTGSSRSRQEALGALMARATSDEQDYLAALLTGELRQGALEGVLVEAIAAASSLEADLVRRAVMLGGSVPEAACVALLGGEEALRAISLELLRPVRPMLASTASDPASALVGPAVVDWKLDGARIQVHRLGDEVRVFTRNLNEVTERVPEVVDSARRLPVTAVVLDGESLAIDEGGAPRRFSDTMSRFGSDGGGDGQLAPFFFDLLHHDGEDLLDVPLVQRLERLWRIVPEAHRVPSIRTDDIREAEAFLDEAVRAGHEGIMVKDADSKYEAGRRGSAWRKVKPVHTLDLVVLAAEWGHGRRTGLLSNLHLGARDPESGVPVMLGKTFKGLTDEMLRWQTERLLELEERRTAHTVWVRPELVVEVALDGLVPSPRYPAGMALRFARVRAHRPDKSAAEADTLDTVRRIFEREHN
ncbi:MAG TPA: ATP-dependent DNA ligase [Acidimicrobiia bacterium]|nr:ATP-dependent DNA ligase [Acidimicrobiia bacterium]